MADLLKVSRQLYRNYGEVQIDLGERAFLESCIPTPQLSQPVNINFYPGPDRQPQAPYSGSTLQLTIDNGFLSPRDKLLWGFPLYYRIIEQ